MAATGIATGAGLAFGVSSLFDKFYPDVTKTSLSQSNYSRLYAKKLVGLLPEQTWQSALRSVLSSLTKKTEDFVNQLNSFSFPSTNDPDFFVLARVSDPEKVRASASSGATPAYHLLEIASLASAQENHSSKLIGEDNITFTAGDYVLQANVEGEITTLSFTLDATQAQTLNSLEWLTALSLLFNNAFSGVESSVTQGQQKVYSEFSDQLYEDVARLEAKGEQPGSEHWFKLSDQTQSLLADLGLNRVAQGAGQTRYRFDGVWREGTGTSIALDNGKLSLEFLDQTIEPVVIEVQQGKEPVLFGIKSLVQGFDDYLDWVRGKYLYIDQSLLAPLTKLVKTHQLELEDLGLEVDDKTKKLTLGSRFYRSLGQRVDDVHTVLFADAGFFPQVSELLGDVLEQGAEKYGLNRALLVGYNQYGQESLLYPQSKPESGFNILA